MMYGLAIGDAMGLPTEFIKLDEIKAKYGPDGIKDLPDPAWYTDDTQMTIAIAEALIKSGDKDVAGIMQDVRIEFIKWVKSPDNDRAPGATCIKGARAMQNGVDWRKSGNPRSKGCGSAMRVAPIGFLYQNDPKKLAQVAVASGICTHGHKAAIAASVGAAYLVKLALDGVAPHDMIPRLMEITSGTSEEFDQAIHKVEKCLSWSDEEMALRTLGEGWVGEEAVALALYCFLRSPDDYSRTILRGANTDGDSDSIASIAGSISGAYLGEDAIPYDWRQRIEKSEYLGHLAEKLVERREQWGLNRGL